jgi:hypothetical protein
MCNFMSLRVVNLDNRPFYTVVKQIIKKAEAQQKQERVDGFVKRRSFHLHNDKQKCTRGCVGENCVEILAVFTSRLVLLAESNT